MIPKSCCSNEIVHCTMFNVQFPNTAKTITIVRQLSILDVFGGAFYASDFLWKSASASE